MKNARRSVCACVALLLACLLVACEPDMGDLQPLAQEGAELTKTIVEGDTAQISRGHLKVKARGRWQALQSAADLHLEISNTGDKALKLNLSQAEFVSAQSERLKPNVLIDEDAQTQPATLIKSGEVEVAAQQTRKIGLSFKSATDGQAKDFLGKTATFYLTSDFKFVFQYVESRY